MITASYSIHELQFKKPARTSRGEMQTHRVYYIILQKAGFIGYGEAAPLLGLSIDPVEKLEAKLNDCCALINDDLPVDALPLDGFPSLQFAFETAYHSLQFEEPFKVFDSSFYTGTPIAINGLVWMNQTDDMLEEAFDRMANGFDCIKFKVGALDFDSECRMLESFRKRYPAFKAEIRLDANGAFSTDDTLEKLRELSRFEIHSIEQPIKPKQVEWLFEVCRKSPIPIALDEELIGADVYSEGDALLKQIQPQFIILKPTLLGGFKASDHWVHLARKQAIGWWATSALESNIGLNAIAQWCATHQLQLPQGLGTGSLYTNNINSPLTIEAGKISYHATALWNQSLLR
jgi:o-succinylbenzoate synthase